MPKYPGRIVSATPPSVSLSAASGVWTLEEVAQYEQAGTWPVGVAGADPYFNQTVLLLHGDGTNGAQNNTFLDSSTNNFTITRNGNTTQGTFSPFSAEPGKWSNYFDGNGDFLSITGNSNFDSTGDFTMEAWAYITSASAYGGIISLSEGVYGAGGRIAILNTGFIDFAVIGTGGSGGGFYAGTAVPLNQWFHVALVRSGSSTNNCSAYLNGNRVGQFTSTSQVNTASNVCVIGRYYASGTNQYWTTGYIASARYVVGTALYSGATYTVPTAPLTAISGTQLLTCQSNRFVDNSTNAFAITRNGDVRVTPFSPFAPTAAYDASVNGGSGYFDGSGDYLTYGTNSAFSFGTGDFTVEAWVYITAANGFNIFNVGGATTGSYSFYWNGSTSKFESARYGDPAGSGVTTNTYAINQWHHVVASRVSGTARIFVNGVVDSGATYSMGNCSASDAETGRAFQTPSANAGYISSLRVVKGSGVTSVTVPTAPLTAISNTSLLCNFTNAGIIDNTGKNVLETVGNAQIDTTTKKYGTGSMEFDGTGDYLIPNGDANNFAFGTGNFTIEGWLYFTTVSSDSTVYDSRPASTNGAYVLIDLPGATGKLRFYANSAVRIESNSALSANTWYHFALVRSSSVTKMYINGTEQTTTYSDTTNYLNPANRPLIGIGGFSLAGGMNGFIDDLRITKGVARYPTEPFPTAPFPDF